MNKNILSFLALLILAISGCDKCRNYVGTYYLDDRIRPYLFNEGTYWVYENTVTGDIDSQYLYHTIIGFGKDQVVRHPECGLPEYEGHTMYIFDSIIDKNSRNIRINSGAEYGTYLFYGEMKNLETDVSVPILITDLEQNKSQSGVLHKASFPILTIQGISYVDVELYNLKNSVALAYETEFYFVKNIGIVKWVEYGTPNGTVSWELVTKNIVQ